MIVSRVNGLLVSRVAKLAGEMDFIAVFFPTLVINKQSSKVV